MNVLSIQSSVAYGHVGNAAATLPLQRLGHEVWPVNTVAFSNHPAHDGWTGREVAPEQVAEIIDGIVARGVLSDCAAVLSGYLGAAGTGEVVLEAVAAVKAANPKAIYCCDPVMGDDTSGFFVAPGIPEFFRERALARADMLCPNPFELAHLAGRPADGVAGALTAARDLLAHGPALVVVSGIREGQEVAMLAVTETDTWCVRTPWIDAPAHGAGDMFAALFLGHYLNAGDIGAALSHAGSALFTVVQEGDAAGGRDLPLVTVQQSFVDPPRRFEAARLG
ncbi:MAG: pyridoxal kinase PdxY [Alphaproteobacteria bacterium]|nr:pyridoxal kinase PdxY [Alphaproteobacteria bacterium]